MLEKLNLKILITSIITLMPVMLGLANGYFLSSLLLALGIPIIFVAINVFVNMYLDNYERLNKNTSINVYHCRWIIPIVSITLMSIVISSTMKIESPIYYIIMSIIGVFVCSSGIKIIEAKKDLTSTYKSLFRNKTYNIIKFNAVGYIWVVTGILFTLLVYLRTNWFLIFLLLCSVIYLAPLLIFRFMYKHVK